MTNKIEVLNHGWIQLSSFMQPADRHGMSYWPAGSPTGKWTGDLEVVRRARQSYNAEWRTGEDAGADARLIHYLMKHRHSTPFEAMTFTFDVQAPIFVFRQWHRHRTWSFSEVSARYTELPEEYYVPDVSEITTQSSDNKQMRTGVEHPEAQFLRSVLDETCARSFETYRFLLKQGVPRELARGVLPVNTYSRMSGTVNLHNLFHFLALRLHEHAQYEIRVYAQAMLELITPIVPVSVAAFKKHVLDAAEEVKTTAAQLAYLKEWAEDARQKYFEETGEQLT